MHFTSSSGEDRLLLLGRIDLPEKVRLNQERKVEFRFTLAQRGWPPVMILRLGRELGEFGLV